MSAEQALVESRIRRYVHYDDVNHLYVDWQLDLLRPFLGRRILEVGCGVGTVLDRLGRREVLYGMDRDPEMVRYVRERFKGRDGFGAVEMDIAAPPEHELARLAAVNFDTVVSINVLEHIVDHVAALRTMASLVGPEGRVAVLVPAHPVLYGAYDAVDGHVRRYTRPALMQLIADAGLTAVMMRRFNAVGAIGWWWQYKLLGRSIHGQAQFGLMTRIVPLCRVMERLVPPPFGLSLAAVCRKRV
jgi:SAM-dependent methyltransferase